MKLPILQPIDQGNLKDFIDFWSKLYSSTPDLEKLYSTTIVKSQFDENDIQKLFKWKNGMALSKQKQNALDKKIKAKLPLINELKIHNNFSLLEFRKNFELSTVWKIFLLHIIKPDKYPIYDQNINRAYNFIHGLEFRNVSADSMTDNDKETFYYETYLKFVDKLEGFNLQTIDQALFAFGQFIRNKEYQKLFDEKLI